VLCSRVRRLRCGLTARTATCCSRRQRRALRRRVFVEDAGDFWLIFETRPYMRARAALAATLWRLGRREEAVGHQRELLRLNPRITRGCATGRRTGCWHSSPTTSSRSCSPSTPGTGTPPGSPTPGRSPRSLVEARAPRHACCSARRASLRAESRPERPGSGDAVRTALHASGKIP
jgi:hypothetical protein